MARILIIEDEKEMALGLKDNLKYEGYEVELALNGPDGLNMAMNGSPDLILLDIMLPQKSGLDVCRELRNRGSRVPVIMLTARGQETDKVLGLEMGADDYVTKPFSLRELLARIRALLRRTASLSGQHEEKEKVIGDLSICFEQYTARNSSGEVKMTSREFDVLKYLWEHPGKTVTRDELIEQVWGLEAYPTSRTVDNFIVKLRKKIEPHPLKPRHILTVHGIGYKFIP